MRTSTGMDPGRTRRPGARRGGPAAGRTWWRTAAVCASFALAWDTAWAGPESETAAAPRQGASPAFGGETARKTLASGLTLVTSVDESLPMVTLELLARSGARHDPPGREGLANLTARCLTLGTEKRSALDVSEALDSMGAALGASASADVLSISATYLKKDEDRVLEILADILAHPTFPDEEVERIRAEVKGALGDRRDDPERVAEEALVRELYGAGGYAHIVLGTDASVDAATRDDIVAFHSAHVRPNNSIAVAVGDLDAQAFAEKLDAALGDWRAAPAPEESFQVDFPAEKKVVRIDREVTQARVMLGQKGIRRDEPDYYAVQVMNYILGGGGFASRLMSEIRVKRGLAYDVASFWDARKLAGAFEVVLGTKNETADEAIRLVLDEIDRIRREPVSEKELEGAKKYLTGSFPLKLSSNAKKAAFLAAVEFHGLGLDYPEKYRKEIDGVTRDDVLRVARQHLSPEKTVLVVVADQDKARAAEAPPPPSPSPGDPSSGESEPHPPGHGG